MDKKYHVCVCMIQYLYLGIFINNLQVFNTTKLLLFNIIEYRFDVLMNETNTIYLDSNGANGG